MSHNYDKVYDMNELIVKAKKEIVFYESKLLEFNSFVQDINSQNINIPEEIHRDINNKLANYNLYIESSKKNIDNANEFLINGKQFVDFDDWWN